MIARRSRTAFILAGALVLGAATPATPAIDETVSRMSLKQKVGQLVMFGVGGTSLSNAERDLIRKHDLGGVILFRHNYRDRSQLEALNRRIQRVVRRSTPHRIGALISVDQEGGVVKRFSDMPPYLSHPELGRRNDLGLTYDQARSTARALRGAGVNIDLAPVADLDLPPNHVMRSRSFGSRKKRVARHVDAFSRGLQNGRVGAALKHFPGLGGATVNSDYGKAYVYRTKWQLHNVDIVPFRKAVARGTRLVMLSHGIYVNDGGNKPASVNGYIARKRLRQELGFKGVAISDALESVAWRFDGSVPRACAATVKAGVDVALITGRAHEAAACARQIRVAVRDGKISQARINRAVKRVLRLKRWLGVYRG